MNLNDITAMHKFATKTYDLLKKYAPEDEEEDYDDEDEDYDDE